MENEIAGKAASAALQNTVYALLSETSNSEYPFSFRYTRSAIFEGAGEVKFDRSIFDRTCGCFNVETGFFTAKVKGVYAFGFIKFEEGVFFSFF
ncbi:unnamed protein product [Oikopleura dioica]|uniref:C1q domain-containing protein n=1 Tax=Oikopleura dioica TaxID=34765 RepID=E4XLP2_OIKDI|nr:unnamed protein product [Oikopleura dioica]